MPFTPFHFGVGLAARAILIRGFSLGLFVALQVAIDCESLYNLGRRHWPVHDHLHTFLGAVLLALVGAGVWVGMTRLWCRWRGRLASGRFGAILGTAVFATTSHVLLDSIMHTDVRPFWPLTDFNPLLLLVGVGTLHLACLLLGLFGLAVLAFKWSSPT